jgi:hypothetical protein
MTTQFSPKGAPPGDAPKAEGGTLFTYGMLRFGPGRGIQPSARGDERRALFPTLRGAAANSSMTKRLTPHQQG